MHLPWLAHDEAPGLCITIPQYQFNKTKQHTARSSPDGAADLAAGATMAALGRGVLASADRHSFVNAFYVREGLGQ